MGNWTATRPATLTPLALSAIRHGAAAGLSRRQLLRRAIGLGIGLWLLEATAGVGRFLWSAAAVGFAGPIVVGTLDDLMAMPAVPGTSLRDGAPAYVYQAKAYVQLLDPKLGLLDGESPAGDGATVNVRALYQRCPHLGCRPNFCTRNFLFECACHQSRYDRLGTKIDKWGPAQRGMDRFATSVTNGVLTIDTSVITKGPLPIALGQPGLIRPTSPTGCI
jgi:cytochrome b6-f complex iron-sulfur subunit